MSFLPKHIAALGRLPKAKGVMNDTESAYSVLLDLRKGAGEVLAYWFEPIALRLADRTTYTPDFLVQLPSGELEFHEIKGAKAMVQQDAWVKLKVAADLYPFIFRICFPKGKLGVYGWDIERVGK